MEDVDGIFVNGYNIKGETFRNAHVAGAHLSGPN